MGEDTKKDLKSERDINSAIRMVCQGQFGVVDSGFLCKSLGTLTLKQPVSVKEDDSIRTVVEVLQKNKIGCVVVVDKADKLVGIFSERDCVLKIFGKEVNLETAKVSEFMTKDPVSEKPECTVAYALNLMSLGGFRHLPIVDSAGMPVGMLSVKDIVDSIVQSFTNDLMNFETV